MDRRLKVLYCANLASFGLFLFGASHRISPVTWLGLATGLPNSIYLCAKIPTQKELEEERRRELLGLHDQLAKLQSERDWLEQLNQGQAQKLLTEHGEREAKLRDLISELTSEIENIRSQHLNELTELQLDSSEERGKLEEKYRLEIARKQQEINKLVQQLDGDKQLILKQLEQEKQQLIQQHETELNAIKSEYETAIVALQEQFEQYQIIANEAKDIAAQRIAEASAYAQKVQAKEQQLKEYEQQLNVREINQAITDRELEVKGQDLEVRGKAINLDVEKKLLEETEKLKEAQTTITQLSLNEQIYIAEISNLKAQLAEYHMMLFADKSEDDYIVKTVQRLLIEADINTEFLRKEEKHDGKVITIELRPISTFESLHLKKTCEQLPGFLMIERVPTFTTRNGKITFTIDKRTSSEKAKANREKLEKSLITVDDCVAKNLGFLVIGEPGSAKSTGALHIANSIINQELSQKGKDDLIEPDSAMLLAFDIHHSTSWDEAGIKVIDNPLEIYEQFKLLQVEYDSRKPGNKTNRLIIFFDEMAETLDRIEVAIAEQEGTKTAGSKAVSYIQNLYRSFGTGGRKKYINFIGMNHSYNVKALGLDGYYRNCFVSILLNDACRHYVNTLNKHLPESKKEQFHEWLELMSNRYIALATGAIDDKLLKHPTHHDYPVIKDGNPPKNLQIIKQLPLEIKLV
ncbi:hypothetical protein NIES2119_31680 [[Phormidium ambiguum] IAM M-71]|uniref:Uncharacterized protein n=1 Tax=[Phormidium ambiguum] IAM M-71 TaxID=454136 RepID=A0A1U7I232_9CYAN|nr:hypothetical protein [Phormidium ambiguum]OKH30038.1 hypothetical protein NIES2119_31680 [Phormidium ambiguum IAM M-71]